MKERRIPDLLVEQALLGEISDNVKIKLDQVQLNDQKSELLESNREILARYSPQDMAAQIQAKAAQQKSETTENTSGSKILNFTMKASKVIPLAAAALLIAAIGIFPLLNRPGMDSGIVQGDAVETTRIKGSASLKIYRKSGSEADLLRSGDYTKEHDTLQMFYNAGDLPFGMILSIDGRGYVTLHLPANQGESTKLQMGGDVSTGYGYTLDDAPEYERFFFVQFNEPVNVNATLVAAYTLAAEGDAMNGFLNLPEGYRQISVTLLKEDQ